MKTTVSINDVEVELKACPFCGNENIVVDDYGNLFGNEEDVGVPIIVCSHNQGGCGCSTGHITTLEGNVEKWNRRA